MAYADPAEIKTTEYVANSLENLVARLREARDIARYRSANSKSELRDAVLCAFDSDEVTVAMQIELLCSRLSEAISALEQAA